jgi:hypothetical protein
LSDFAAGRSLSGAPTSRVSRLPVEPTYGIYPLHGLVPYPAIHRCSARPRWRAAMKFPNIGDGFCRKIRLLISN